jgi:uncharacterized membrane protein
MRVWRNWWWAIFPVGVALRLANLGGFNLWYDEAGTSWMASLPFSRMIAATAGDVHPPLFFIVEWALVHMFGIQAWIVRLPSALAAIASLYLMRQIAERIRLEPAAILAGSVVMVLAPFQLYFAQEARMYSLLQFFFLAGVLAALNRKLLWLGAAIVGLLWTHNYGVIYSLPLEAIVVAQIWRHNVKPDFVPAITRWSLMNVIALGTYTPWALVMLGQMGQFATGHWLYWFRPVSVGNFVYPFYVALWMFALPARMQSLGAIALAAGLIFALVKVARTRHLGAVTLTFLMLSVPLAAAAISLLWDPIYLFRALIGMAPPMYLLIAWALTYRVGPWQRAWAAGMFLPLLIVGAINYYPATAAEKGQGRQLADFVAYRWHPGDVIYHVSVASMMSFRPYSTAPAYLMAGIPGSMGGLTPQTRQAMGMQEVQLDQLNWSRAWLVWAGGPLAVGEEDRAVHALLARYRSKKMLDIGDSTLSQGGMWLLWR